MEKKVGRDLAADYILNNFRRAELQPSNGAVPDWE